MCDIIPPGDFEKALFRAMPQKGFKQLFCAALDDFTPQFLGRQCEIQFNAMKEADGHRLGLSTKE